MFSESRKGRNCRIVDRAAADRLRDRDNSVEIGDDALGIVDIAAKVIPCKTPSGVETGVTLSLEDNFRRGSEC